MEIQGSGAPAVGRPEVPGYELQDVVGHGPLGVVFRAKTPGGGSAAVKIFNAVVRMRPDFVGAVGLNKIARFRLDPRDRRDDADFYELVGDDNGVFGCMSLLGCHDMCPKELPLATQIAFLRRKLVAVGWK